MIGACTAVPANRASASVERLSEKNLPKILIQGGTVYCRMKADDFRFPLPPGSRVISSVVTGGFDTVNGNVSVDFPVTVQGRITRELSVNLGSGGATVRAMTTNGGVRLRRTVTNE